MAAVEETGTNASLLIKPFKDPFNPYSSIPNQEENENYEFAHYKVPRVFSNPCPPLTPSFVHQPTWPKVDWEPLTEFPHTDVGHRADPEKKSLLSVTTEIDHLSPAMGTRLGGVDLRKLTDTQKDELYA
jgi:sulfonate dioxygenase